MTIDKRIAAVTKRIVERSRPGRELYLSRLRDMAANKPKRSQLGCANLAHGFAVCSPGEKARFGGRRGAEYRHHHRL